MSISASRLGSAPITIDWSQLCNVSAGRPAAQPTLTSQSPTSGPTFGMMADVAEPCDPNTAWEKLRSRFQSGEVGYYDAPMNDALSQASASQSLAQEILARGTVTDCLFLGIGGSSLGPISLVAALEDRRQSTLRFHFMENPDPLDWKSTTARLNPDTTLVVAVTKSGTTFETLSQLLLALDWLGQARAGKNLVVITDPTKGDLRAFATHHGFPTLSIAPSIGGRFSIFSPVGLFPAALAGLSVDDFLLGARIVRDYSEKTPREKNPTFVLARELLRHASKRPVHVCMPYSTRLKQFGGWFVQLWGESLGKDGKGFTPLGALGATDQHSILQLLRDGPDDKITIFITADQVDDEVKIPRLPAWKGLDGKVVPSLKYPAFSLLEGHTLHSLLRYEYQATSLVLSKRERPHMTVRLDRLDEKSMGALYFFFSMLTAVTGTLWEINPFDQPGVEEGKTYIRGSLSHAQREFE